VSEANTIAVRARRVGVFAILVVILGASAAADDAPYDVARVEEDWELVIDQPDTDKNGPQVTCTISPHALRSGYAAFDVNYHTQPNYYLGGLQLHAWSPLEPIVTRNFPANDMLATPGETITWTQTMSLNDWRLKFQVINGQSQTWGSFGGHEHSVTVWAWLWNLNGYSPEVTVANSGVSFASNRVTSLTLKAVRWYDAAGELIQESTTPRVVYPKQ